jgi:Protein of unknown function (DUF3626)
LTHVSKFRRQQARIVLHFHPDRFGCKPANVAESLFSEGVSRNQFETGLSSGSPTAFPGGERDTWEHALFGGAYHTEGVAAFERPKYRSLELVRFPDGPSPRFGSCYFVLRGVAARTSITFMGSEEPRAFDRAGTLATPHGVMAALLAEIRTAAWPRRPGLHFVRPRSRVPGITVGRFCELIKGIDASRPTPPVGLPGRVFAGTRVGKRSMNSQISTDSSCGGIVDSGSPCATCRMTSADRRCRGSRNKSPERAEG